MKNQFPKQIHVAFDPNNRSTEKNLLADVSAPNLIDEDGPTEIATYELRVVRTLVKDVREVK